MQKKSWAFIIIVIVSAVILGSCDLSPLERGPTYTSGIFVYRIYKESGIEQVRIIDISHESESHELNSIVFPTIIDGKKVGYIGDYQELRDGVKKQYFKYTFDMTDKVYIPAGIVVNCKFKIGNNRSLKLFWFDGENRPTRIIDEIYIPFGSEYKLPAASSRILHKSNISFKYNFEYAAEEPNYGYFWIDHLEDGEQLTIIPNNPQRDGYSFEGWYIEPECINAVDFEAFIKGNVEEESLFYAKWKEKLQ